MDVSCTSTGSELLNNDNKFVDQDRASNILKGLSSLYSNKQFVDVTLCSEGREFACHKSILALSSPYFMAMFSTDMAEKQQDRIELKEISAMTLELVLEYIYTGEVMFSEEIVQNLLSAANLFALLALRHGCAEYMMQHVTVTNCIGIYFFSKAHQCDTLAVKAKELINMRFGVLCHEHEFLSLPIEELVEIVSDDALNVSREETVYEACMAWLHTNLEERKQHLLRVMSCVRFGNVSSYYFCDNIDSVAWLKECRELDTHLKVVKYHHMLKNRYMEVDLNFVPRKGMGYERGMLIMANPYVEDNNRKFNTLEILFPKTGTIRHLCKLPQSLYMPGACTTGDNQIYLAGGAIRKVNYRGPCVTEGVSDNFFLFDKGIGSWQVKPKMNFGRTQFCLVMVDGLIFAIAGQNELDRLDSVERYDPQTNSWTVMAPMPQKLRCMTATAYRGKIYVFGGENEGEIVKTAYRYDPQEDIWLELSPMLKARALAGCVVYRDKIYVIGGNSCISMKWKKEFLPEHCVSVVEVFDPVTSQWSLGPELPNALCGAGVVKYGDTIMVVGGEDDRSWMAGLFVLKEEKGSQFWVEGQELPNVMSTFACVVANVSRDLFRDDTCI